MPTVFFSYCHKDEVFRDQLEIHLSTLKRQKAIESWHDRKIIAGSSVDDAVDRHLDSADVILLLVSPDFIASDYCYEKEMQRALQRHKNGTARVIPVILRPCDWHDLPFGNLLATPTDGLAITLWTDRDQAFLDVVKSIKSALKYLAKPFPNSALALLVTAFSNQTPLETAPENEREPESESSRTTIPLNTSLPNSPKPTEPKEQVKAQFRRPSVGVDMGTSSTRIYIEGQGIALDDSSAIAIDPASSRILGVGRSALEIVFGHTSSSSRLIRPLSESVISDPDAAFHMLRHFLSILAVPPSSHIVFAVPEVATKANLKILYDIAKRTKVGKVEFVSRTHLAAVSDGVPIEFLPSGIIVEIGSGTTDVSVLSDSRMYYSNFIRVGGNSISEAILEFMKRVFGLVIGERSAELIKVEVGSAWPLVEKQSMEVKGHHQIIGGVRSKVLTGEEIRETICDCIEPIVCAIRKARERTHPSIFSGVTEDMIVLSGGSALLRGIGEFLCNRLDARVLTQKDPSNSVASGFRALFERNWKPSELEVYPSRPLRQNPH